MKLRFSLRKLFLSFTFISIALYLVIVFWPPPPLVPGYPNLHGMLKDTQGNPVPDAIIEVYDFGNTNPKAHRGAPLTAVPCHETETDRYGKFRFQSIKLNRHEYFLGMSIDRHFLDGNVFIKIDHETHCLVNSDTRSGFRGICFRDVDLIKDFNYEFNFKMMPGGTVSGCLVTPSGRPIANSRIRFVSQKDPGYFRTYVIDDEGKFETYALSPGSFDVELEFLDISKFELLKQELPKQEDAELKAALRVSDARADRDILRDPLRGGFYKFDTVTIKANKEESFDISISMEDWLDCFREDRDNDGANSDFSEKRFVPLQEKK